LTNLREQLQAGLSGSYVIERELGRGGMATVYLARDVKHDRPVALKVLLPELAATLGPDRFQREIRFAARLQHPHILTVHDSGETAGQLWFTMPYVEGESLRTRLQREGQLALKDALRIAREAAQALHYAHSRQIVHRDIKPENILLTADGSTLVADFGIARGLGGEGEEALTQTGMSVGTPQYMSPEQANGARGIDARSDIYSLGCVLYEMLAGEPPYTGPTAQVILMRRFTDPVPSVRKIRANVPEAVDQAIQRALAQVPGDRFPTAAAFAEALETVTTPTATPTLVTPTAAASAAGPSGPAPASPAPPPLPPAPASPRPSHRLPVGALLLALGFAIGLGVLFAWRRSHSAAETEAGSAGAKRVAVLPFENLGRPEDDYFADGITDEIRGKLAALPGLQVTASNSSGQYKKTSKPPQQIGQELGVQYLLVGKVRWEKGAGGTSRVRVSPELVQVATGSTKWQQPFDAALIDVFQVQADIAGRVAQALDVALEAGERERLAEKPTGNLAAYDLYLQGNEAASGFDQVAPVELRRAIGSYERAIALDSTFALAWAQLSRARSLLYFIGVPTASGAEGARLAAERTLALSPGRAEGHLALADYHNYVRQDWAPALQEYAAGRKLAPNDADLLKGEALVARSQGRWEESRAALRQAQALDPRSIATARRLATGLVWLRRYPEALEAADGALTLERRAPDLHETKAMVFLAQGDLPGARAVVAAAEREVEPTALLAWMAQYWDLYWVLDERQQELLLRIPLSAFDNDRGGWGIVRAQTYYLQGDQARARVYADSARLAFEDQLKEAPENAQSHMFLGLALAYLGRKAEAVREGERGLALLPVSRDAYSGAYDQHQLARIYLLVGEPDKALDQLEPLLRIPYYLSPGWLRIDPTFAPLKGNPRFEKLVAGR
jgi:TolB-like protein/Flp pilus assembly protein TadD